MPGSRAGGSKGMAMKHRVLQVASALAMAAEGAQVEAGAALIRLAGDENKE